MTHRIPCLLLLVSLGPIACGSTPAITSCEPIGHAAPLCGFQNPEDLALLPDGRHVVVSEYGDVGLRPGRISLLDLASGGHESLFAGGPSAGPGTWGDPHCEAPALCSPHGIHLSKR